MATQEEVRLKTGVDNSAIRGGMVQLHDEVERGVKKTTGSLKSLGGGLKSFLLAGGLANIFGIGDTISNVITEFIDRGKDLGEFWGAFSVGGIKAVQTLHQAERAAEAFRQKLHEVNKARFEVEERKQKFAHDQMTLDQQQIEDQKELDALLAKQSKAKGNLVEVELIQQKIENKILDIQERQLAIDKAKAEEAKRAAEETKRDMERRNALLKEAAQLEAARAGLPGKLQKQLKGFAGDDLREFMPTIDELAKSGHFVGLGRKRFVSGVGAREAQDFLNAKQGAINDFNRYGLDDETKRKFQSLQAMKKPLADLGILPEDTRAADAAEESSKRLQEIKDKLDKIYSAAYE